MKNLTCLTTWLVVVAPLICGLGCGASTQTSHYEYLPTNHQDTQAGDAYKNNRSEKFKYFKYNVSFNLANDKDMEFLIKIEKCNGSTCEPIKGKAIYIRDSMTCEADSFEFFGISDETGSAKKHPGWFDGQQFCMGGVTPSDKVIYISNKIQSSKFEKQQNLSKGDTCPGKKDIIVGATPSVQASLDRRKEEIENHKQFISDLIHVGTISSFGKEFSQRCNSLADKKLQATLENFRNENSSTAEILIAKCKSSPDDNNCEKMIEFFQHPKHGVSDQDKRLAEEVYKAAQPAIDDTLWNNAYPSCAAPTNSNSCEGVKRYLSRFRNGKHAGEAQELIQKVAPVLQRFAMIEAEAENERIREENRRFQICVGVCMGNGNDEYTCRNRCR